MQLVQQKIAESRTNQSFILLEGFCNSKKLENHESKMQMRTMDEFFAIQRCIGEVCGVISLQNEAEPTDWTLSADMIQEPVKEEIK